MKKFYSYTYVYLAVFCCLYYNVFAKTTDDLPVILKPTPVRTLPVRFKPLPFRPLHLTKVDLYQFDQKAYVFDKITSAFPVLSAQEWKKVSNDPVRFTLTLNEQTAYVGEEIELTLTAELLNISPSALFTFEELREYTLKVVLPNDFIQNGGTYYDFVSDKLDIANPKKTYTIKGRYLAKPALDDCFKVLRKLNNEVFVLKNIQCPTITDVDLASTNNTPVVSDSLKKTREIAAIDTSKIKMYNQMTSNSGGITEIANNTSTIYLNCYKWADYTFFTGLTYEGFQQIKANNGAENITMVLSPGGTTINTCRVPSINGDLNGFGTPFSSNLTQIAATIQVYSTPGCSGSPLTTLNKTFIIDRTSACPVPPTSLTITTSSTTICSGNSATLEASNNCSAANITWKKNENFYSSGSSSITVSEAGSYKAVCSSPALTSNTIAISVSTITPAPNVTTDKNTLTPGEFAQLTASNCSGTILWTGPDNFADVGSQISVNKAGGYNAKCKTTCIQNNVATDYYSSLSATINISIAPLRIQANKTQIAQGESVTVTAYGCTNGYIKWKINDNLQPTTDNPFTFNSSGFYSASCNSWDGSYTSEWVTIFIHQVAANTPTISANKLRAYNNENVVLTASGCSTYYWVIPVRQPNGTYVITTPYPSGTSTTRTVTGPANYQVGCTNQGPWASATVYLLQPGDITLTSNKTVANIGEAVELNVTGDCPGNAGIQWKIMGESSWTTRYESKTVYGAGTYEARCIIDDFSYGNWTSIRINAPAPGGITISSNKTSAGGTELVTLRANGCEGEVVWTLPNNTEVRGSSILFATGAGTYAARCVRFGISGAPATIVIQTKPNDAPRFYATQATASGNQIFQLVAENCPNNAVQWGVPKQDANGNTYYDYANFFQTLIVRGPGTYQVRCNEGNYTSFQDIVVFPNPSDALTIVASKAKALPVETVVLTAFGCPNGTVQWDIGGIFITGVQFSTAGPGNYKARCIGDPTNNGDWAIASILPNGSIVPSISSTHTTACPGESVTLTAYNTTYEYGCPAGWPMQWQYVKDDKIEYWLNNRNAIENFGENYGEVFETISANPITRTGPRVYYVRCMKPDLTWIGEFKDKSFIVEPVFPEYLRASNNGPAMMGATGIKVAVTQVPGPNITYSWAGPGGFTSGSRIADVTGLTEAKSGIYTVTVSKTGTNGCNVTSTTNLVVSGCSDIRIKVINPSTSEETNKLPLKAGKGNQYDDLALSVETLQGESLPGGFIYNWGFNRGTLANATNPYIVTNKSGIYTATVKPNSTASGCKVYAFLQENEPLDERWDKAIQKTFASGIPVTVVPVEPFGYNINNLSNANKVKQHRIRLLNYTLNNVKRQDLMLIFPYESYLTANNYKVKSNNFSGTIVIIEKASGRYLGGWRYNNGTATRRLQLPYQYNVGSDPCAKYELQHKLESNCGCGTFLLDSQNIPDIYDYVERNQLTLLRILPYDCGGNSGTSLGNSEPPSDNNSPLPMIPPVTDLSADTNWGLPSWLEGTGGPGTYTSHTQTTTSLMNVDDAAFEITLLRENIRRGVTDIIEAARKINGIETPLTAAEISILIKILDKVINSSLGLSINSNSQAANISSKILDNNFYGASGTFIPDNLTLPPLNYEDALRKLLNQKESVLNSLRAIVNIRLAVGENTANSIINNYQTLGKDITKVLVNLEPNIFAQKIDIQDLWIILGGSLTPPSPITTSDGVTITFTTWVENHPAKITFKKGDNEISIFAFPNVDIKNNDITNPCLKTLTNIIKNDQIKAEIQKILVQDFKDVGEEQNIVFKENSNMDVPGQTSMGGNGNIEAWIDLNPNLLSAASKEYGISVILHECLHASLNVRGLGSGIDNIDHFAMIKNGLPLLIDGLVDAAGWNKSDPDQYKNAAALTLGGFANVFVLNPGLYNSIASKYQLNETSVSSIQGSFKNRSLGTPCN